MSGVSTAAAPAATTNAAPASASASPAAVHSGERVVSAFTPEQNVSEIIERAKAAYGGAAVTDESEASGAAGAAGAESTESTKEPKDKPPKARPTPEVSALEALAKEGKFQELIEALGVDAEGLNIPSSRFAQFRKQQRDAERKLAAREDTIRSKESEFQSVVAQALAEVEPLSKAKSLYESGDVLGALQSAFGDRFETVIENAIRQQGGKDPELIALKRKDEQREREASERRKQEQESRAKAERTALEQQYVEQLTAELTELDHPLIPKIVQEDPAFASAVYRAQLAAINDKRHPREITPEQAALDVLETIRKSHMHWGKFFGGATSTGGAASENTARAGKTPSNTDPAGRSLEKGKRNLPISRVGAAPAKRPEEMSREELLTHFSSLMKDDDE